MGRNSFYLRPLHSAGGKPGSALLSEGEVWWEMLKVPCVLRVPRLNLGDFSRA